jgi:hypothetical protein
MSLRWSRTFRSHHVNNAIHRSHFHRLLRTGDSSSSRSTSQRSHAGSTTTRTSCSPPSSHAGRTPDQNGSSIEEAVCQKHQRRCCSRSRTQPCRRQPKPDRSQKPRIAEFGASNAGATKPCRDGRNNHPFTTKMPSWLWWMSAKVNVLLFPNSSLLWQARFQVQNGTHLLSSNAK